MTNPCDCDKDVVERLAKALATVIGKYVPVEEQSEWAAVLNEYIDLAMPRD